MTVQLTRVWLRHSLATDFNRYAPKKYQQFPSYSQLAIYGTGCYNK